MGMSSQSKKAKRKKVAELRGFQIGLFYMFDYTLHHMIPKCIIKDDTRFNFLPLGLQLHRGLHENYSNYELVLDTFTPIYNLLKQRRLQGLNKTANRLELKHIENNIIGGENDVRETVKMS